MTVQTDIFLSDGAGPSFPLAGAGLSENALTPARPSKASSITETIDLGRRVLELADKLGSAADRRRAPSFRLLAKQLVVPKGASSVWRAAAIYRLAERYPELYGYQHLGVGHLAVLLSLRGPVQLALLRKAERMRWSRRKLEAKVKRIIEDNARGIDAVGPLLAELESDSGDLTPDVPEATSAAAHAAPAA
ncbi:MAG TPA: hypothetical protein VNN80_11975 [Polyangiaceae bacterium]|nr:hypothetical protein [Polyangiaceae bacterium]